MSVREMPEHVAIESEADPTHLPAVCKKGRKQRYSYRNHSTDFICPVCGRTCFKNLNWLGQGKVMCDGIKFTVDRSYKDD